MKILLSFLIFLLISDNVLSQWYPIGTNNSGYFVIVSFENENIGWGARNDPMRIFKTIDSGESWLTIYEPTAPITSIFFLDEYIGWFSTISGNLYYTSDGGDSWVIRFPDPYWHMEDLYFFDSLKGIATGSYGAPASGGIFKTTNGGSNWQIVNQEEYGFTLNFLTDSLGWCGSIDKLLKTTDGGENWNSLPGVITGLIDKVKFQSESIGWLSTFEDDNLYFTNDGGNSWIPKLTNVLDFYFTDLNNGWYTNGEKIFNTTNGGISWQEQYSDTNNIRCLYFLNSNMGWAVDNNGLVLRTLNGGTPVELISFSAYVDNNSVTLNWITGSEINNLGFDIEKKSADMNHSSVKEWEKIGFVTGNGTTTEKHFYSFIDKDFISGKYQYRLKQIDFDGTFEYSRIVAIEVGLPQEFYLSQNYPNPFNPTTSINYQIKEKGFVSLKVVDMLGNEVAILVNEKQDEGQYSVNFNASNLSSGVYIYSMRVNDFVQNNKMTLLK